MTIDKDEILDVIFQTINELMWMGDIEGIDRMLDGAFWKDETSLTTYIGFLTITIPVKSKLKNRKQIYELCTILAMTQNKSPSKLLQGLE